MSTEQDRAKATEADSSLWERRTQTRVPVHTQVRVALNGGQERIVVQNRDLSWGGASLLLPVRPSELGKTIGVELPWGQGRYLATRAEVVRAEPVGNEHTMVGVRFSKLMVRDEERLERLLGMLIDAGTQGTGQQVTMAERFEVDFIDREDMRAVLSEIREGWLHITSFRPYRPDQSLLFVINGFGDLPSLQLRARVEGHEALKGDDGKPGAPRLFSIDLRFEHPAEDLKRVVDPLISSLGGEQKLDPAA
jgi:hypothetical protein